MDILLQRIEDILAATKEQLEKARRLIKEVSLVFACPSPR